MRIRHYRRTLAVASGEGGLCLFQYQIDENHPGVKTVGEQKRRFQFVQRMGWDIRIDSLEGSGTTVHLVLPLGHEPEAPGLAN